MSKLKILLLLSCISLWACGEDKNLVAIPSKIETRKESISTKDYLTQIGGNPIASWSHEQTFIDVMKLTYCSSHFWSFISDTGEFSNSENARKQGLINLETCDLIKVPDNTKFINGPIFFHLINQSPEQYNGDWVLDWKGSAKVTLNIPENIINSSETSITFKVNNKSIQPIFSEVEESLTNLRLYKLENKSLLEKGNKFNPDLINLIKEYDIFRSMDYQGINVFPITKWDEISLPTDNKPIFYNAVLGDQPFNKRYGISYKDLCQLSKEADNIKLWVHIPIMLGSPNPTNARMAQISSDFGDTSPMVRFGRDNQQKVLNSPVWNEFSQNLYKVFEDCGYNQHLYIEVGNEVWNTSSPFNFNTRYVQGIGNGNIRKGYGLLSGKAFTSLRKAGFKNVTFVIASQTANPSTTSITLQTLKDSNISLDNVKLALTSYYGGEEAYKTLTVDQIKNDPIKSAMKIRDHYLIGNNNFGKNWIIDQWKDHLTIANQYNVELLGAYEGGSHDTPPHTLCEDPDFTDWWEEYHWGPIGSEVLKGVNQEIIDQFNNPIISNFGTKGYIGNCINPWHDGLYNQSNSITKVWKDFN